MNKVKLLLLILLMMTFTVLIGACNCGSKPEDEPVTPEETLPVESDEVLKLSYTYLELDIGDEFTLEAINAKEAVVFTSANPSVATVTSDGGVIVALKLGETTITATSGNFVATCTVKVVNNGGIAYKMSLVEPDSLRLFVGGTFENRATVTFKEKECTEAVYTYTSSDNTVATVTNSGLVTALKLGECTITVSASNIDESPAVLTKSFIVKVVEDISLTITNASDFEIYTTNSVKGNAFTTNVQAEFSFTKKGQPYVGQGAYSWEVKDDTIATVNGTGLITGVSEGTTDVRIKYTGSDYNLESEWMPVTVRKPVVEVNCEALIDVTDKTINSEARNLFGSDKIVKVVEMVGGQKRIEYTVIDGVVYGEKYNAGSDSEGNPVEKERYLLGGDKDIEIHTEKYALKMKGVVATKVITTATELLKLHEYTKTSRLGTYEGYIVLGNDIKVENTDYNVQYEPLNKLAYNNGKFFSYYYDLGMAECLIQAYGGSDKVFVYSEEAARQEAIEVYNNKSDDEILTDKITKIDKRAEADVQEYLQEEKAIAANDPNYIEQVKEALIPLYIESIRKYKLGRQWEYADGSMPYDGQYARGFKGTFDGRGYTISNLNVMGGLFVRLAPSGVIKNVAFDEVTLVGDDQTYLICKYNLGTIDNVFVSVKETIKVGAKGTAICSTIESTGTVSNCAVYHNGIKDGSSGKYRNAVFNELKSGGTVSNVIVITDETRVEATDMKKYASFEALFADGLDYSGFNSYWDVEGYWMPVFKGYSGSIIPERAIRVTPSATRVSDGDVITLDCNYNDVTVSLKENYSFKNKITINGTTVTIANDITSVLSGNTDFKLVVYSATLGESAEITITIVKLQKVDIATPFGDIEIFGGVNQKLDNQITGEIISVKINDVQVEGFTVSGDRKITIPANALESVPYGDNVTISFETAEKIYVQSATVVTKILKTKEDIVNIHSFVKTDTKGVYDGYLVLGNDIDMTGAEYIVPTVFKSLFPKYAGLCPYSDADYDTSCEESDGFKGILDGRGHSINNLSIFIYGIFYTNSGTIKNIAIYSTFQQANSATIALKNKGTIDNVFISVNVINELQNKNCFGIVRDNYGTISNSAIYFPYGWDNAAAVAKYNVNGHFNNVIAVTPATTTFSGINKYADFESLVSAGLNYSGFNAYWDLTGYQMPVFKGYSGSVIPERALSVTPSTTRVTGGDSITLNCNYNNVTVSLKENYSFKDTITISGTTVTIANDISFILTENTDFELKVHSTALNQDKYVTITIVVLPRENITTPFGDIEQLSATTTKLDNQITGEIISVKVNGVQVEGFTVSGDRKITIPANALKNVPYGDVTISFETADKIYIQSATLVTKILKTKEDIVNIHSFVKTDTKGVYDGYLVLGNDIDMTGAEYVIQSSWSGWFPKYAGLSPYADDDYDDTCETADGFIGIIDGRGHSINNLSIFIYGIFYTNSGTIKNIAIASTFQQPQSTTIALKNKGTIDNVFISVNVRSGFGEKACFGIVRDNYGTISNSVVRFMQSQSNAAPVAMYNVEGQFSNVIAHTTSTKTFDGITIYNNLPTDATYTGFNTDYWDTTTYKIPLFKGNPFNLPGYTK